MGSNMEFTGMKVKYLRLAYFFDSIEKHKFLLRMTRSSPAQSFELPVAPAEIATNTK
jgi:hypothetical protein